MLMMLALRPDSGERAEPFSLIQKTCFIVDGTNKRYCIIGKMKPEWVIPLNDTSHSSRR